MNQTTFLPESIYRFPWNFADNAISWLEPTSYCNLYCDGCYRENRSESHKTIDEIKKELNIFKNIRKTDGISIAGGEPLLHPQICDIVSLIAGYGWKPIINSNAATLNVDFLKKLKTAGVFGFTFHIDSGQIREGWKNKTEIELNDLRLFYAEMVSSEGGMCCSFNATIYPETVHFVPDLLDWSHKHIDKVNGMVFILYRMANLGSNMEFYAGKDKVNFEKLGYSTISQERRVNISSLELVDVIREKYPDFTPSAFLNGSIIPDSYKWLFTGRMGTNNEILGYSGPKFMEITQTIKHLFTGSYLAYSPPSLHRKGKLYFLLALFDEGIKKIFINFFKSLIKNPLNIFKKIHFQSIMIIQPADVLDNGEIDMCDGCPDMTVWKDKLVWSCRMEEQINWGQNVRFVPENNIR